MLLTLIQVVPDSKTSQDTVPIEGLHGFCQSLKASAKSTLNYAFSATSHILSISLFTVIQSSDTIQSDLVASLNKLLVIFSGLSSVPNFKFWLISIYKLLMHASLLLCMLVSSYEYEQKMAARNDCENYVRVCIIVSTSVRKYLIACV